jgi:hypothetical protein
LLSPELNALRDLWDATPEPNEQTRARVRARLLAEINADAKLVPRPVTASARRPSRRLLLALAVGFCIVAALGATIAAGLGAFSNTTASQLNACVPSATALTTASGARVRTGHTESGIYCIAYQNANGTSVRTAGRLGAIPAGEVVALKALDTVSNAYVIAGVVPTGYDTLTVGSAHIPIENQVFIVDPELATDRGVLSGPAGRISINLSELAAS